MNIINNPVLNKSTSFNKAERKKLQIIGLLPYNVEDINIQIERIEYQISQIEKDFDKYIYLFDLFQNNQTLYFNFILRNPLKYIPIIYNPTIGSVCLNYHKFYKKPYGLYLCIKDINYFSQIIDNY